MGELNPINKSWCLEQVCEANYQKIFRLAPDLRELSGIHIRGAAAGAMLYITVLEQTPHTRTIELNHCFSGQTDESLVPSVKVRVYLDARMAEVIADHVRPGVDKMFKNLGLGRDILNYKWRLNLFLHKWLEHCLSRDSISQPEPEVTD